MNASILRGLIDSARFGDVSNLDMILDAADRICRIEELDAQQACIHVWHSGLTDKPYMFEIRRSGVLYGDFMDIQNRYASREDAERMAVKVCESMIDGTFEETYTYLRTRCPRCKGPVNSFGQCEKNCPV